MAIGYKIQCVNARTGEKSLLPARYTDWSEADRAARGMDSRSPRSGFGPTHYYKVVEMRPKAKKNPRAHKRNPAGLVHVSGYWRRAPGTVARGAVRNNPRPRKNPGMKPIPGLQFRMGSVPAEVDGVTSGYVLYHFTMGPYTGEPMQASMKQWIREARAYPAWAGGSFVPRRGR
mgnify:FL=1